MIEIEANLDELKRRLPSEKTAKIVMWRALNRGATAGKTHAARELARNYAVRVSRAKHSSSVKKASQEDLEASVVFRGRPLNITAFKVSPSSPQPSRRPVLRAVIRKSEGPIKIPGAFLAPLRAGVRGMRRKGKPRLPIEGVFGPAVPSMVSAEGLRESVLERMREVVLSRLDHEVNRELGRLTR
ncbi:MAG TPA: phage tail protein [Planctomycetota bacterium]|nr:phage tail protein [Planctomycetota bacterium]